MPGELMLLNPRRKSKSRKRRTPAQLAATRKLVALNRRRGGGGKKRRAPARRRNPVAAMPYRRKRRRSKGFGGLKGITRVIIPAAIGGAGALAIDIGYNLLPIPPRFKTGMYAPAFKIAGALGIGWLASMFTTKQLAEQIMIGSITVTVASLFKGFAQRTFPQVALGEIDEETLAFVNAAQFQPDPLIGGYVPDFEMRSSAGIAEYISPDGVNEMGEYIGEYVT